MSTELNYSSRHDYCMEYSRYRVYSSSVELNKASYSPNPLCIDQVICIVASRGRWYFSAENPDVLQCLLVSAHLEL